ncbi:MAG: class I SAM-dependent methyltransferase [Candidatus Krumholzibacteriota bacterium]|nr:class I SAM-dependent methyltransferase [Candidatus Krumholzibacteriota bacterium]
MTDTDTYIRKLIESNPLREPLLRSVVKSLGLPRGSRGLDAGCGIGLPTLLLAEAIGAAGHVTGLDRSAVFLRYAEKVVEESGLLERISLREGDLGRLPFEENSFDWVWSVDCVGYPVGDLLPLLRELARVVKPGGTVAILGWSSQCLLPGYPLLEARLNATCSGIIPLVGGCRPESHFLRAGGQFQRADLESVEAVTFVHGVQAPLSDQIREALLSLLDMLWGEKQPEVAPNDWAEYQRLSSPQSPQCILNLSDYYGFFTYSMFRGRVPR